MVNGNYILYGDRPSSESEIVDDHVHSRTIERKPRRHEKRHRTANELQHSLNMAQIDNETDSAKYEKKIKEPRLLRYVSTTDAEENFVADKFETYDLKPSSASETPRRHGFTKKPKNPADGSVNYAYSRSSSSCSSPNLPTITEHCENYGTYRVRPIHNPCDSIIHGYENKLDKYFSKPREVKKFAAKGSHPDSLYRVSGTGGAGAGKIARFLRILRWPAALVTVCVALAVFVYFLMPENIMPEAESVNGTYWEESGLIGQSDELNNPDLPTTVHDDELHDSKPPEIDFYDAVNKNGDITTFISTISDAKRPLPVAPVYPIHITPEVQYGNEKADIDKLRNPKTLTGNNKATTVKPHITQKPEKPLEVYFKDALTTVTADESVLRAETMNDLSYNEKQTTKVLENNSQKSTFRVHVEDHETESAPEVDSENDKGFGRREPVNKFTSGHSNNFGISMEDAELMKATTQSSAYKTRVSPTLPTWRDGDDATTKNYPGNVNADVSQCRSTRLSMCRGILPYDLAGAPAKVSGVDATIFLPQIEYLVSTNCSRRVRHFACALLEPECSPLPYPTKKPCFNLCKSIKEGCEGHIPRELAFMFHCNQYSRQNCLDSVAPCFSQEFGCSDGTCIPREWLCDGSQDCPSGEDEVTCRDCLKTEYRCRTGECIQRRWLCDGYSDCPDSDDETEQACRPYATGEGPLAPGEVSLATGEGPEQGEESAGSAPAPAVRRPNRIQQNHRSSSVYSIGEGDSSKELLMTSDSNNALKRNYTRRPSPSRLIPYNRHFKTPQKVESNDKSPETEPVTQKAISDSTEDVNVDELGFYGDIKNGNGTTPSIFQSSKQETMAITDPDYATDAEQPTPPTFLDKTVNKLERVINGAEILKKVLTKQLSEREEEVPKSASIERAEEYPSVQTAHISPCPSGELRCVDGRCITLAQLCDGTVDCSDHADEENCYT